MIHSFKLLSCLFLFALSMQLSAETRKDGILFLHVKNPAQTYAYAGKLHWNNREQRWDRVIVAYNDAPDVDKMHPVLLYVKQLKIPSSSEKHQYNLHYKPFHLKVNCSGKTPLSIGNTNNSQWRINFDEYPVGQYSNSALRKDWNCPKWAMGSNLIQVVTKPLAFSGNSLRINYPKGSAGCSDNKKCVNWKPKIGGKFNQLYYSYKIKIPKGFDFVKGGKLPGIAGGTANTGGNKPNGTDGWSVRMMWNQHGKLVQYVYHPDQQHEFGDTFEWKMDKSLERGKWHTIKTMVRINTPSRRDGEIKSWLDGKLVLDKKGLRFRNNNKLQIDRFMFASFFGGSDWSWAPKKDQSLFLDEFVLSTKKF